MNFFNKLVQSGVSHANSSFQIRSILFFNYLILFCLMSAALLCIGTLAVGVINQAIFCLIGVVLFVIPLFLNFKGFWRQAKLTFLLISTFVIAVGTYINLQEGLFVESENMFLALMAVSIFLVGSSLRHVVFWLLFLVFIGFKIYTYQLSGLPFDFHFILLLINNAVVSVVLYAFLFVLRRMLIRATERSQLQERTLLGMIDNVSVFMAMVDPMGNYIVANEKYARNFKLSTQDLVGKNRTEVLPKSILEAQQQFFERAQKGQSVSFLQDSSLPGGVTISANGSYEPLFDKDGNVDAITICVDDVSELVTAQKALKEVNETKNKLFSILAHDIKSPLNLFQGVLSMNQEKALTEQEFNEYQEILTKRLKSLTDTVDELLIWSRMQLNGISTYPVSVAVKNVIIENIDLFDGLVKKKNIHFQLDCSEQAFVWVDENHFKMAVRNLIHNALKYSNVGGAVSVEVEKKSDLVVLHIIDSGIGMNQDTIDSIINQEIQDSKVGTDKEMGTGLGLSLSLGLLEKNNCKVAIHSEINNGTEFIISIPVSADL